MRDEPETTLQRPDVHYRFLDWCADPSSNRLFRGDEEVRLTPRAMDVLSYLIKKADRVVSKEELLEHVWNGQAVTDDALVVTIYELRKALGDRARQPTYIQTVVRRGYRFLPSVERFLPSVEKAAIPPATLVASPPPGFWQIRRPTGRLAGLLAVVAFLAVTTWVGASWGSFSRPGLSQVDVAEKAQSVDPSWIEAELAAARLDLDRRTPESLAEAERRYAAIEARVPGDVRALAGQARVAALEADLRLGDRFELYFEARTLAEKALALDPKQTDALLALASAQLLIEWDPEAASQSLSLALAQSPEDPDVHQMHSWSLSAAGSHELAIQAAEEAVRLSSGSVNKRSDLAFVLVAAGHFDRAALEAQDVLEQDPANAGAWAALIRSQFGIGSLDRALDSHLEMLREFGVNEEQLESWNSVAEGEGYWAFVEELLRVAAPERALVPRAAALANLGEKESALGLLERAVERRDWEVLWLESLPELAPLRPEKRFQVLLDRLAALRI